MPMAAEIKSGTVLDRIVEARRAAIAHRKKSVPETVLRFGVKQALPVRILARRWSEIRLTSLPN